MNTPRACLAFSGAVLLAACATSVTKSPASDTSAALSAFSEIIESVHRQDDDLLTAGLGLEGLRQLAAPSFAEASAPTPQELRRRAIWANWRGIADLRPDGGTGNALPTIPGREFSAFATLPNRQQPHRVLLQLPDSFSPQSPCVVVAAASGSRGVYGAIAVASPWALAKGCAVAFTDKGAGTDYVDLASQRGVQLNGQLGNTALAFTPPLSSLNVDNGMAFKHAHSQDNPEADWGAHVHQAAQFALHVLNQQFTEHTFTAENTRVIATGISNGGGAVLRAAEVQDTLIDAVVAGEPNIYIDAPGSRALYDYGTQAALLMPCALLTMGDFPAPPMPDALSAAGTARCAQLASRNLVKGATLEEQAQSARQQLIESGFDERALHSGSSSVGFDLWRSVVVAYASAYGRYGADEHPCGFQYSQFNADGSTRPATVEEHASWWSDASGIPPGNSIGFKNTRFQGEHAEFEGLLCLRDLWDGKDVHAQRVQTGIAGTRAELPRDDLPIVIVHGRDDGLIPMAFSSLPYVAKAQAAQREVVLWPLDNAQHFDAFLAFPTWGARYVPLLPTLYRGLDAAWERLEKPQSTLPEAP